jgi:hypothetical protein
MKAKTFDSKFDSGEKIVNHLDLRKARRIGTDAKRVNVDFPAWMVDSLDREARRLGVTRPTGRCIQTLTEALKTQLVVTNEGGWQADGHERSSDNVR